MNTQSRHAIACLCVAALLSGCATIATGTKQSVSVNVVNAPGAKCAGVDQEERKYYWNDTPASVMVQKGDGPMTLTCERKGFKKTIHKFDEIFQGATLGNILLGGGIGIIIDAASGAAQIYPNEVKLVMEPEDGASREEMDKYARLKQELLEEAKRKEEEEGFKQETETVNEPKSEVASKTSEPDNPEKSKAAMEKKALASKEEKSAGQEVASLPATTKSPTKPTPNWSAYLSGEDFSRIEMQGLKKAVSIVLFNRTSGKLPEDIPIFVISTSDITSRIINGITQYLSKQSIEFQKTTSRKVLLLVKVQEWEFERTYPQRINLSATNNFKEIDSAGKILSSGKFNVSEYTGYHFGFTDNDTLYDFINEHGSAIK